MNSAPPLDKDHITALLEKAHSTYATNTTGANADYIPYLAKVPSQLFGIAVAFPDGSVLETGDTDYEFAIESISKVFNLALAIEQVGPEQLRQKVGADATGLPFNSVMALALHDEKPLSPLVNAGAMSTVSLIKAKDAEDRWQQVLDIQSRFAGRSISLSEEVNQSEQTTNFHNRGIAWILYSANSLYCDPMEACDVYTRGCSTLVTARDLALMGATLANGGVHPLTKEQVVSPQNVPRILSEMVMEGLYTASGDWLYSVGLPGKSGVGGGILAVAPGKLAISVFSPPLDKAGNSVRGQLVAEYICRELGLSIFSP
ncbi:glutaminase 1 [Microbulbifer aestuariivivens]|uniref:Glutaminase n=1 Tax=Microbulbifer aestuariivivens TaxID=1908308 RepID=A0ABP9WUN8_9GAMM